MKKAFTGRILRIRSLSAVLACTMLCLFLLAGCHGAKKSSAFEVPESFDTTVKHEITFWAKNDTNKTQTRIYEKAIRDFEALYPNITVRMRLYTDYGKIYNDVITNISTGTTPNVCITYPDHIATYLTGQNIVVPLDLLFGDPEYGAGGSELLYDAPAAGEMIPQFMEECTFSGHLYALPFMRSTEACYINQTYVEALGFTLPDVLTWDFIREVSEAAMEKDADGNFRINGQKIMIPFIYKSTDNMMIQMLKQKGAGYSDDSGKVYLFNDDTAALLKDIAADTSKGLFSTFKLSGYPANFLNAGQCIFAVDSTAGATWMGTDAPLLDISEDKLVRFETAVRPVPQFDPEDLSMISQGPSVCIFNKEDPQEVLASWLFMQFLLTNDVQISYSCTEGYVPVTDKARQDPAYQAYLAEAGSDNAEHYQVKIDAVRLLLDHTGDTFVTPVFNGSASLRDAAGSLIENVTKSVRRRQKVDDAYISALYDDTVSLYHLNLDGTGADRGVVTGPLPAASKALIGILAAAWVCIAAVWLRDRIKSRQQA